ncbi:MAG: hypothetical protein JWN62_2489, partial [Acidimicrobiales bacterium]|nr:hypothetical protein [Acidimicrobiales bacterium]
LADIAEKVVEHLCGTDDGCCAED